MECAFQKLETINRVNWTLQEIQIIANCIIT